MEGHTASSDAPDEQLIEKTALTIVSRYGSYIDKEDVEQELRLWWLTNQGYVQTYLADGDAGQAKLAKALKNAAVAYCEGERKYSELGTTPSPDAVRRLLQQLGAGNENGVPVAEALAKLRDDDQLILYSVHIEGRSIPEFAMQHDISVAAAKTRESRAIERLIARLGPPHHEGPGAREAIANTTAIAQTTDY